MLHVFRVKVGTPKSRLRRAELPDGVARKHQIWRYHGRELLAAARIRWLQVFVRASPAHMDSGLAPRQEEFWMEGRSAMRTLKQGDRGTAVRQWQIFLIGQGFDPGIADGHFGARTANATRDFQGRHGLSMDGVAGNRTIGQAMVLGFGALADQSTARDGPNFPPPPEFPPLTGTRARQQVFGRFQFEHAPVPGNFENIRILGGWVEDNIVSVRIPALATLQGAPLTGEIRFHRKGAAQLQSLWEEWQERDLLDRLVTWDGSFVPRFIRGSTTVLSNHAFGTAFDVNASLNPLGAIPALVGQRGSVRELVDIANRHGFFWGGHFRSRLDGMHFEVASVL